MLSASNSKKQMSLKALYGQRSSKRQRNINQSQIATTNMTLLINDVELSIPQGTPAAYLAELIGALS